MTDIAPSCPISRSQPTQPQPPHADITHIPPANDLRTALNALRALRSALQNITRSAPQINNVYPATVGGVPVPALPGGFPSVNWVETGRGYTRQAIQNPDNVNQSVTINTLAYVEWTDQASGHVLRYKA